MPLPPARLDALAGQIALLPDEALLKRAGQDRDGVARVAGQNGRGDGADEEARQSDGEIAG